MGTWVYQFRRRLHGWMEGWVDAWIALSLVENLTVPSYFARADFKVVNWALCYKLISFPSALLQSPFLSGRTVIAWVFRDIKVISARLPHRFSHCSSG